MNWLKENWFKAGILVVFLFFLISVFSLTNKSVEQSHFSILLRASGDITCTYPQVINGNYFENKVSHEIPPPETNPFIFTFSDVQEEVSKLKYIDATQTISEVPIIQLLNNDEKIVFVEGTGDAYITLHTIFKNTGISIYSKQVSLLGIPIGTLAIGTCIDS